MNGLSRTGCRIIVTGKRSESNGLGRKEEQAKPEITACCGPWFHAVKRCGK